MLILSLFEMMKGAIKSRQLLPFSIVNVVIFGINSFIGCRICRCTEEVLLVLSAFNVSNMYYYM